jgi:hypothetical protein
MIYLAHTSGAIAACETAATAQRARERGFVKVNAAAHRALWKRKDRLAWKELAGVTLQAREFGGWVKVEDVLI